MPGRCGSSSVTSRPASSESSVERSDRRVVRLLASPDRQRGAPVALARERPVDVVPEPVPVAAVLDVLGVPVDLLVDLEQPVLDGGRPDVPRAPRDVDQRRVAPPAQGIGVDERPGPQQQPARTQVRDDGLVGLLEERAPDERRRLVGEPALAVERLERRPPLPPADLEVLAAERGRQMDHAGAVLERDEVGRHHAVGALDVRVQGLVRGPDERGSGERPGHDRVRPAGRRRARPPPGRRRSPSCSTIDVRRVARRPPAPCWRSASRAWSSTRGDERPTSVGMPAPRRRGTGRRRSGPRRRRTPSPPPRRTAASRIAGSTW